MPYRSVTYWFEIGHQRRNVGAIWIWVKGKASFNEILFEHALERGLVRDVRGLHSYAVDFVS